MMRAFPPGMLHKAMTIGLTVRRPFSTCRFDQYIPKKQQCRFRKVNPNRRIDEENEK